MARYPLGTTDHIFRPDDPVRASIRARALGFHHIDVLLGTEPAALALPVGYFMAHPRPVSGRTTNSGPPRGGDWSWASAVEDFRAAPGCLLEPSTNSMVDSVEATLAFMAEVPGLRLMVDTGHVAGWGDDPVELLRHADHVQLRQGGPGRPILHVDDPNGTVDFAAVLRALDRIDYAGLLTIEYYDFPKLGLGCEHAFDYAMDLMATMNGLMGA